jgi:hypothetical protein
MFESSHLFLFHHLLLLDSKVPFYRLESLPGEPHHVIAKGIEIGESERRKGIIDPNRFSANYNST